MRYYVGTLPYSDELSHFGIKGQKWGVRRYQNPDGSLTAEGKARYGSVENLNKHRQERKQKIKKLLKLPESRSQPLLLPLLLAMELTI